MDGFIDLIILALATIRITRFITTDTIFSRLREKFWSRFPPEKSMYGYLITCNWCSSVYAATLVMSMYRIIEGPALFVCSIFALSFVAGFVVDRAQ
jgi:multisubunit Na+/H+ antiporter MnhF subunit